MRVAKRYRELVLYGTRLSDVLPRDANWHAKFNWVCNIVRRCRYSTTLQHSFNTLIDELRDERTSAKKD